jgi:hypothetical protein
MVPNALTYQLISRTFDIIIDVMLLPKFHSLHIVLYIHLCFNQPFLSSNHELLLKCSCQNSPYASMNSLPFRQKQYNMYCYYRYRYRYCCKFLKWGSKSVFLVIDIECHWNCKYSEYRLPTTKVSVSTTGLSQVPVPSSVQKRTPEQIVASFCKRLNTKHCCVKLYP